MHTFCSHFFFLFSLLTWPCCSLHSCSKMLAHFSIYSSLSRWLWEETDLNKSAAAAAILDQGMELEHSCFFLMELQPITPPTKTQNTTPSMADTTTTTTTVGRLKTSIHVTALDGIVNVNSLFTMAIFIGFSLTVPEAATAASRLECTPGRETVRRLIVFEVVSFSFFLFSSLIAQSLKLAINLLNNMDPNDLFGSAIGSVVGCSFLMLSIVDFIQVKLGTYSCGGKPVYAVVTLVVFVGFGLAVYVSTAVYASFFVEISSKDNTTPQKQKS